MTPGLRWDWTEGIDGIRHGSFLEDVDQFDAEFFREASQTLVDGLEVPALSVKTWIIPRCVPMSLGMSQEILEAYRFLMMVIRRKDVHSV